MRYSLLRGLLAASISSVIGLTAVAQETVKLAIDGGEPQLVNGLAEWNFVIEEGSLSHGRHTLTARAAGAGCQAEETVSVLVPLTGSSPNGSGGSPDTQSFEYVSSVDGTRMTGVLFVPEDFNAELEGPVPLVVHLHGGGGRGNLSRFTEELRRRRGIGISPDGREWGLAQQGCGWQTSAAYVDSEDPSVGPGEQDILDAIRWAQEHFPIDPDRIYLAGFSMGGRGAYAIGLKNPDVFAAIAPMGPASDMYEIFVRRPEPRACKEGMMGGQPGDSSRVDTMYTITSGRFLIENAYNLPVFHGHGTEDPVPINIQGSGGYLHGWHMTVDNSWDGCHGDTDLCFGHTPTLSELKQRHPGGYDWAYMFTPVAHTIDSKWISGAPAAAGDFGLDDPESPGRLLGIMDFLARRRRVYSPDTVVFKTYEDRHQKAYWVALEITTPWEEVPGAVRATRDSGANSLKLELSRAARLRVDLPRAALSLHTPLSIEIDQLTEPTYDPALMKNADEVLDPFLVLTGDFQGVTSADVMRDGAAMDPAFIDLQEDSLTLGPLVIAGPTAITVTASPAPVAARPRVNSVQSAAGGIPSVAPASIASIDGNDLAAGEAAGQVPLLPTEIRGTSVLSGGVAARLYYVSPGQINFVVPENPGEIVVVRDGLASAPVPLETALQAPAIFTFDGSPNGRAAALHANFSAVSPAAPARQGEIVQLYVTGLGRGGAGPPEVMLGGQPAPVHYHGPAPGFPGLEQINFEIPGSAPAGQTESLTVAYSSAVSNAASLAVAEPPAAGPPPTPGASVPPDSGLLFFATYRYRDNTEALANPDIAGALLTMYWSDVEPEDGRLDWADLERRMEPWITAGKKVALRIMWSSNGRWLNPAAKHPTPSWVLDQGAVTVFALVTQTEVPLFWDPVYQTHALRFLGEVARRFDGDPNVLFIDVTPGAETNPYCGNMDPLEPGFRDLFRNTPASDGRSYSEELWRKTVEQFIDDASTMFDRSRPLVTLNRGVLDGPSKFKEFGG